METDRQIKTWRKIALTAIFLLLVVSVLYALGVGWKKPDEPISVPGDDYLISWTPESVVRA